jgi:hypothetical protein
MKGDSAINRTSFAVLKENAFKLFPYYLDFIE